MNRIFLGLECPYCGKDSELIDSKEMYHGTSYGMMYICRPCQAWVGCHKGTTRSLGRLANDTLRKLKHEAHEHFDILWRKKMHQQDVSKGIARAKAYIWLSDMMGTDPELTHIGMFNEEQCERVIEFCKPYL
jgi:hypothetical protein